MGDLASQIHWGTGFENVLDLDYPELLDDKRCWRRPAPGSARARNSAGTTDAAVYGRDYMLAGRARWFGAEAYSNPVGLQAFIDWAAHNTFRFVPDKTVPDFYVDGVTLDEPFDDPAPSLEQADGSQSIDVILRHPTANFGQLLRGIMFEYAPGQSLTDPVAFTFTRASVAAYLDRNGKLQEAASGVLRRDYTPFYADGLVDADGKPLSGNPLEGARTNLVTWSDALSNWTSTNTPVITDAFAVLGDLSLTLIEDNDAGSNEGKTLQVNFTGDGVKGLLYYIRAPNIPADGAKNTVRLFDITAAVSRFFGTHTWNADGTMASASASVGTILATKKLGNAGAYPVYAVYIQLTSVTAANTHQIQVFPAGFTPSDVGKMVIGGVMVENAAFPSLHRIKTTGATATRAADAFSVPWNRGPMNKTVQTRSYRPLHADVSGSIGLNPRVWRLGASAPSPVTPKINVGLAFLSGARNLEIVVDTGTTDRFPSVAIPAGAEINHVVQLKDFATGAQPNIDVGSGFGGFSAAAGPASEWNSQTLYVGTNDVAGSEYFGILLGLKIAAGLHTSAVMLTK